MYKNVLDKGRSFCYHKYVKFNKTYFFGRSDNVAKSEGKYAWTVTVGTKGQIVLPKEARDVFDIKPGDTLIILGDKDQGMAIPPKNQFSDFFGKIFGK